MFLLRKIADRDSASCQALLSSSLTKYYQISEIYLGIFCGERYFFLLYDFIGKDHLSVE